MTYLSVINFGAEAEMTTAICPSEMNEAADGGSNNNNCNNNNLSNVVLFNAHTPSADGVVAVFWQPFAERRPSTK